MLDRSLKTLALLFLFICACSKTDTTRDSLRILLPEDILTLDPNQEFETITDAVLFNVYEPLVGLDKDMRFYPLVAESWENPKPEEWRFHLRKNVFFHDGSLLTADVVREVFLKIQTSPHSETSHFLAPVRVVETVDDHTLRIICDKPYSLITRLPFIYIVKQNSNGNFPPLAGTGPYTIRHWNKGESILLTRFDRYWGKLPVFKKVEFIPIYSSSERFQKVSAGQAEIGYWISPHLLTVDHPELRIIKRPGLTVYYLGFNLRPKTGNPFVDPRVRKAIHIGINRREIVARVLHGHGSVPTQPVSPAVFGFNPELPPPSYNPQEARRLLKEAGYSEGFSVRLDFSLPRLLAARLIRDHLALLKIQIELNGLPKNQLYELAESGLSDLFLAGWDCTSGDASEFYEFCLHTKKERLGIGNYGNYSNPEVDNITEINNTLIDQKERRQALYRLAEIIMQDLPVSPVYIEDDLYVTRKWIRFEPRADSEIRLQDVEYVEE